jgi:predicted MFS family arabinose efflux permease
LGGLLIEYFHWGAIFFINVPIVAVALIAGWFLVPNSRDPHPRRLDIPGTILSAFALSILVFGLIQGGDWGWTDPVVGAMLAGAVVIGLLFVIWERHTANPMLDMRLFRHPRFSVGAGSITLLVLGQFGMIFGLTLYMQFVLGYSALETGIRFLPMAVGMAIGSGMSHRLVGRFGTTRVIATGFLGFTVIVFFASFWQIDTPYLVLGLILLFWGFFNGNIMAPAMDSVLGAVPEARSGVGSAMNSTSIQVGGAIGVGALGSVLSSVYSSSVAPAIAAMPTLPAELADAARDSVGTAIIIAGTLPEGTGDTLALAARESFMDAWQVMALVVCGIGVVATGFILRFMPPRHLPEEELEELAA